MGSITTSRDGDVAIITLDEPERRNAVDTAMLVELDAALIDVEAGDASAVVLNAEGPIFSAGGDLSLMAQAMKGDPGEILGPMLDAVSSIVTRLDRLPIPSIAAVEGAAVGAGMSLALATDLRVVGRKARLIGGFLSVGVTPDSGASYMLTRSLGRARTLSVVIRNEPIDADRMVAWGLAEEMVDDGAATDAALELARAVGALPSEALIGLRQLVDSADRLSLPDQLAAEDQMIRTMWGTANYAEGVAAFEERRSPRFTR